MSTEPRYTPSARLGAGAQHGFTLIEVLVALVVFAISVVGLVAMEGRSIEAQRASAEIREAERVAQEEMSELSSQSFMQLLSFDFAGNANPAFPYDDADVPAAVRLRHFRRPPADLDPTQHVVGGVRNTYIVFRTVDMIADAGAVPPASNPPVLPPAVAHDSAAILGLQLEVSVLWIDRSNPTFQPPETFRPDNLTLNMVEPTDPNYAPWVGHVRLRTVRINDIVPDTLVSPPP